MVNDKKLKEIKKMECGDLFRLTDGKEYYFINIEKNAIIGKNTSGKGGSRIPFLLYDRLVQKNADPVYAKQREQEAENVKELKTLGLGDQVKDTEGTVYLY